MHNIDLKNLFKHEQRAIVSHSIFSVFSCERSVTSSCVEKHYHDVGEKILFNCISYGIWNRENTCLSFGGGKL